MKESLKNLQMAFSEVFANTSYIALASALAVVVFLFAVWLPNFGLIGEVFRTSSAPLAAKLKVAISLLGGIGTNFSFLSAGYTIAIAVLFGVHIAMVTYFLKRTRLRASFAEMATKAEQGSRLPDLPDRQAGGQARARLARQDIASGFGGAASGVLGIGCAACGSFILSTTISSLGAASAIAILPLRGGEFGILSVVLLLVSLVLISKKIAAPLICKPS